MTSVFWRCFGAEVDYAMLVKIYGNTPEGGEVRYSPAICMGARPNFITGTPDHNHVSTSICERQNLTMRMSMRRFTRLTNGYSKKLENLEHNVALYFMNYNFCRIHHTLRVTPAMEAGIANHVLDLSEVVALIDAAENRSNWRLKSKMIQYHVAARLDKIPGQFNASETSQRPMKIFSASSSAG